MLELYTGLLADTDRIEAFDRALRKCVRAGDVVVDLGCGVGTYAMFAARAGARRVFGVESGPVIEFARQLAARNGLSVDFIRGDAREVELPERASLLVFEDFSTGLLDGVGRSLLESARQRWMNEDFRVLPERASLHVAPISSAAARSCAFPLGDTEERPFGLDLEPLREASRNNPIEIRSPRDLRLLGAPRSALDQPLERGLPARWKTEGEFEIEQDGPLDGLCLWFDLALDEETSYSNHPSGQGVWGQYLFPVPERWSLRRGERLRYELRFEAALGDGLWAWSLGTSGEHFSGNTFAATSLTPAGLQRYAPDRAVPPSARARLEAEVLGLVDGERSIATIATELRSRGLVSGPSAEGLVVGILERHRLI